MYFLACWKIILGLDSHCIFVNTAPDITFFHYKDRNAVEQFLYLTAFTESRADFIQA